jgi:hypothetical protein
LPDRSGRIVAETGVRWRRQQPSLGLDADDRFAPRDGAELTIESATIRA